MKELGPSPVLWEVAEDLFENFPNEPWLKKNKHRIPQSVIRSGKELYAISELIGYGLTSKVKDLVSRSGMKAVAKFTGGSPKDIRFVNKQSQKEVSIDLSLNEKDTLERLGLLLGYVEIELDQEKKLINDVKHPECKVRSFDLYSKKRAIYIMPKYEGRLLVDMLNELPEDLSTLTTEEALLWDKIALGCSNALLAVHKKDVIHCDLKTDQFIVNIVGGEVYVRLIDFGWSIPLDPTEKKRGNIPNEHAVYAAPEAQAGLYEKASDIYSLGRILEEFPVDNDTLALIDDMCQDNPDHRMQITEVVKYFEDRLPISALTASMKIL